MDRGTDRGNLSCKIIGQMDRRTDGQIGIMWKESLPMFFDNGQMDRRTDRNNLGRKSTPSLERMDRWTDGQIEIYRLESLPPLLKELSDGQIKIIWHETLLTAEDIWFNCDLSLRFIPPINLWKICIDLRPFSKCFHVPFSRTLRSLRSNNLETKKDENFLMKIYEN